MKRHRYNETGSTVSDLLVHDVSLEILQSGGEQGPGADGALRPWVSRRRRKRAVRALKRLIRDLETWNAPVLGNDPTDIGTHR